MGNGNGQGDLWDNVESVSISIRRVHMEKRGSKGFEKMFEKIVNKTFPNLAKEMDKWVQALAGMAQLVEHHSAK